ncbi:MAG: 5,10-methylene tetrahydromethanopterin reductase [Solirubrobacterales bacterium]|nr:5,10-methylene tetrahydromethanopterin reductase [Solirubrobacterales bacterium]
MTEFGLLYTTRLASGTQAARHRLLRDVVQAARLAEDVGFDRFYVQENELPGGWHTTAPEVILGAVAVTTSRIRLAHGSACSPFTINHPVRIAQRAATVDILSDGRLDFIFSLPSPRERSVFGLSEQEATVDFPSAVTSIVTLWIEGDMEQPSLVQQPHPNLMMACTGPDSVRLAGTYGLGVLCDGAGGPDEAYGRRSAYDAAIAMRRIEGMLGKFPYDHFTVACRACVLESADEAREEALRARTPGDRRRRDGREADRAHAAYGTARDAIEVVEGMVQAGADEVLFVCDRSELSRETVTETIRNLGRDVIPHFQRPAPDLSASEALAG